MVWDILLQAAAAFVVGAAAGYAFATIVEALSRALANPLAFNSLGQSL